MVKNNMSCFSPLQKHIEKISNFQSFQKNQILFPANIPQFQFFHIQLQLPLLSDSIFQLAQLNDILDLAAKCLLKYIRLNV